MGHAISDRAADCRRCHSGLAAIANSIGVRERQKEMAIMKVLGFLPRGKSSLLVMGEAILVGELSGGISRRPRSGLDQ